MKCSSIWVGVAAFERCIPTMDTPEPAWGDGQWIEVYREFSIARSRSKNIENTVESNERGGIGMEDM